MLIKIRLNADLIAFLACIAQIIDLASLFLQNHGGVIINITATLHYRGTPMQMHAGAAKAAIGTYNMQRNYIN